jgi:hypothetical protein
MPPTVIRGTQVLDGTIQRPDLDVVTAGKAVVVKLVQGSGITLSSTGVDSGTGDVTVSGVDPGTWTNLTYSTGWTQNTTAQFRVEVNGAFSTLKAQGIINYASGAASLAFTLPAGARPSVARGCALSGFDSTGDVLLFSANIATTGAVTIYPIARQAFSWPSATNGSVYLDSLSFSL